MSRGETHFDSSGFGAEDVTSGDVAAATLSRGGLSRVKWRRTEATITACAFQAVPSETCLLIVLSLTVKMKLRTGFIRWATVISWLSLPACSPDQVWVLSDDTRDPGLFVCAHPQPSVWSLQLHGHRVGAAPPGHLSSCQEGGGRQMTFSWEGLSSIQKALPIYWACAC